NKLLQTDNLLLKDNNRELSAFSYIASHDLQEPLRKIHTFGKLIADDVENKLSQESKLYLERITVSAQRMQQLTQDLLNYSHINTTDNQDFQTTDLNSMVHDALGDLNDIIKAKKASISVETLPTLQALPLLMHQLFINLIENALKYSR